MTIAISLPVTRVTVLEDRAQVERAGPVAIPSGERLIELTDVSALAVDRSLKVELKGAQLVDAKIVRRWKEKPRGLPADATALRRREDALEEELKERSAEHARLTVRGELLESARADLLRAIQEHTAIGKADTTTWTQQLDALSRQEAAHLEATLAATRNYARTQTLLGEARSARTVSEQKDSDLQTVVALTVEGSGPATVRVSYLVPCAVWRPAYRASLVGDTVTLESEAVVWQRTGEAWNGIELSLSTARPTLGTAPPTLAADHLSTRPKQDVEKKVVDVTIREQVIQTAGEGGEASPEMPGLDDGGEARLLRARGALTIPSDGLPHRVPLGTFEAKAQLERVSVPELSPLAYTIARFPNAGSHVLLAGPVHLVRNAGFVGRSQLKFAAPQELIKLSFGSEDGVVVTRESEEKTEEARLTGRKTQRRTVTLHVSNAGPETQTLIVEERIPVSEVKEVEVAVLAKECDPAPGAPSKDGVVRMTLQLPPNATKKARFTWELSAAGKVAGL